MFPKTALVNIFTCKMSDANRSTGVQRQNNSGLIFVVLSIIFLTSLRSYSWSRLMPTPLLASKYLLILIYCPMCVEKPPDVIKPLGQRHWGSRLILNFSENNSRWKANTNTAKYMIDRICNSHIGKQRQIPMCLCKAYGGQYMTNKSVELWLQHQVWKYEKTHAVRWWHKLFPFNLTWYSYLS